MNPTNPSKNTEISPIVWQNDHLQLLDQRLLPHQEQWVQCHSSADAAIAIADMVVRGAPAIGITAAYAVVLATLRQEDLSQAIAVLRAARPTAVNLAWALDEMTAVIKQNADNLADALLQHAQSIHRDDLLSCKHMGELGADFIQASIATPPFNVMTHCNTGALATAGYGTALGVIRSLASRHSIACVYVNETRPWLQGARLTAWELQQEGIAHRLQADSAAAHSIVSHDIKWIIVGADRIAANGDVVNKIGTFGLGVLASQLGAKLMVVAPEPTIDMSLASGQEIPIEQRAADEVSSIKGHAIAPHDTACHNPAFDMTPAALVSVLVTDKGVIERPNSEKMRLSFSN